MKTLPNGLKIFNATPHLIRFWMDGWAEPIEISTDKAISAQPHDQPVASFNTGHAHTDGDVWLVRTAFVGDDAGEQIIADAKSQGAHVIVGSIIAAQAYPGKVVAMVPAPGYERVPPEEKRMRPDKFTTF